MASVDVTVFGAGIFGLSVAWACLERGARVRVIDPHGVGAGASGGVVGALAPHVPENWNDKKEFQFNSLISARAWWDAVRQAGGLDPLYYRTGRLQPVPEGGLALARQRSETAAQLWRGQAEWRVIAADERPWGPQAASGYWIEDTLSAHLHPAHACAALAEACRAQGGEICQSGAQQGKIVWATGAAGLRALSDAYGKPVGQAVKGQAALLQCDMAGQPQIFADGVHIVPHGDGTVAIGSTTEREALDLTTDHQLDEVILRARRAVPALENAPIVKRWAGLRPRAQSRAPLLGALPGRGGEFVANGGFKIGFGMAPEVARVMALLLLEGKNEIPGDFDCANWI